MRSSDDVGRMTENGENSTWACENRSRTAFVLLGRTFSVQVKDIAVIRLQVLIPDIGGQPRQR